MLIEALSSALNNLFFFALNVDGINVFPKLLSPKEEAELFSEMSKGNKRARNKLIEHNLRLVAFIVKKYYPNIKEQEDLISTGTVGLIKAVTTFDCSKGNKFATYASKCIENEILMQFRSQKKYASDIFIDEPIDTDKDGNQLTFLDIIADEKNIIDEIDLIIGTERLYKFINECLDSREFNIIVCRYGLFGHIPLTQKDVAKQLKISRSYVSRLEKRALEKLKECLNPDA